MKRRPSAPFTVLALLVMLTVGVMATAPALGQPEPTAEQAGLELCLDANGRELDGDLDILLLLDDSASLQAVDRDGLRFDALQVLLEGLAATDGSERVRNIAVMTYGERTEVRLGFQPLEETSIDDVVSGLRTTATAEQRLTDYIGAIRGSIDVLSDRPLANCRILVWFTDGDHDLSDVRDPAFDAREAAELREAFCPERSLADRLRDLRINTFVLMLASPDWNPERQDASRDVIQIITGDPVPAFPGSVPTDRQPSGLCDQPLGDQLGRVLPASRADELPGLFADLQHELDGGRAAMPIACPYPVGVVDSLPLPDAHLIRWFSLTDVDTGESGAANLNRLSVVIGEQVFPAEEVVQVLSSTGGSVRFEINPRLRDQLTPGWQLRLENGEGLCLRVRPVTVAVEISTGSSGPRALQPPELPAELLAGERLRLVDPNSGRRLSRDEALGRSVVTGQLIVEHGEVFANDSTLPVEVVIAGAPVIGSSCQGLQIPAPGTRVPGRVGAREAPEEPLFSSDCTITPATQDSGGRLDWAAALAALNDPASGCALGSWDALVDGTPAGSETLELIPGGEPVTISLRSTTPPANEDTDCTGTVIPPIRLEWGGDHTEIGITVSANWLRRSSPLIATLIALPLVVAIVALSLLLLQLVNRFLLHPPRPDSLWGFRESALLELPAQGRPQLRWAAGGEFEPSQSAIARVGGDGGSELSVDGRKLRRRLPTWFRPWEEPSLELVADAGSTTVAAPMTAARHGTLPLGFPSAVVLTTASTRPATSAIPVPVELLVMVPRMDRMGAGDLIREAVRAESSSLAGRLQEVLEAMAGGKQTEPNAAEHEPPAPPILPETQPPGGQSRRRPPPSTEPDDWR